MAQVILGVFIGVGLASFFQAESWMKHWPRLKAGLAAWRAHLSRVLKQATAPRTPKTANAAHEILPPAQTATAPAAEEPLSVKLRKCEAAFLPLADNASHPREFYDDPDFKHAVSLLANPATPLKTVTQYALGTNWGLSCAAFAALAQRADKENATDEALAAFERFAPWVMFYALSYFLTLPSRPPAGSFFMGAKDWWQSNPVMLAVAQGYFEELEACGDEATFGASLDKMPHASNSLIRGFLEKIVHPYARDLIAEIDTKERAYIDRTYLSSFGRFWTVQKEEEEFLEEPESWQDSLAAAEIAVSGIPSKSLLVSGEHSVGKTSFLRVLARRLDGQGWTIFEASGADIMAGQKYIGEIEGRIREAIERLAVSKRVIWYIPDIMHLALSGTHQGQSASILDQILPAIASGRLLVWTETAASAATKLLRMRPSLRNHFEVLRLEPTSKEETLALANGMVSRLTAKGRLKIDPALADTALQSSRQYLSGTAFPGSVLDLLKSATSRAIKGGNRTVAAQDVILSLSQATGVPAAILDSKERADLAAIRAHFTSRVIGQEEAVAAIVDRIAMMKAGLNDPGKPIGVFLFAGPTGTGKTELAKTLAEFLFGSAERMIRLDMSEFQAHDSAWKILGTWDASTETLISRVRKQPFSVVLLDEFEKAHANIWDLFLQVFDDGRLTDASGQEADFRHCIIILTTNLGATAHRSADLGFLPSSATFSREQVLQSVSQTFRPEFQNRLDKVIVFQPLTRELMRGILKKELAHVLERRGFLDREWAVEWEASALEFLLERGFSPEMGARPLKRAIDQYVIAPLAATIVERRFPEGDQFVFIRSDGKTIQAEFVDPDGGAKEIASPPGDASGKEPTLPAIILGARGAAIEVQALEKAFLTTTEALHSDAWEDLKASLVERMQQEGFWNDPGRKAVLARVALMDRVKAAAGTAESFHARLVRGSETSGKHSRELIARLALQIYLISEGIKDVFEAAPIEVALKVEPALDAGDRKGGQEWCAALIGMYKAWAAARNMQISERNAQPRLPGTPILLVSGFGAHRTLRRETGLHVLEIPEGEKTYDRFTARVRVAPVPLEDLPAHKMRALLTTELSKTDALKTIVRQYRDGASPLVRDAAAGWRTGRYDAVMRGDFDLLGLA
ncbi:MAG: AAA family ATPase [Rhodomicrobium sp.]